jgi:hypothetical protein
MYLEKAILLTCKSDFFHYPCSVWAIQILEIHRLNALGVTDLRQLGAFILRQDIYILHLKMVCSIGQ